MKRSLTMIMMVAALAALTVAPVLAAGPTVTKSVMTDVDGTAVVLVRVSASGQDVYGVTIQDASSSITDIVAPKGWVGISSGSDVLFRTGERPIKAGTTMTFRLVTTNQAGTLSVTFRDKDTLIGQKKTI